MDISWLAGMLLQTAILSLFITLGIYIMLKLEQKEKNDAKIKVIKLYHKKKMNQKTSRSVTPDSNIKKLRDR